LLPWVSLKISFVVSRRTRGGWVSFSPVDDAQRVDAFDVAATDAQIAVVGRSPWQLAWRRLRHDRVAIGSGIALVVLAVLGLAAPLISLLYGVSPNQQF
jgi:hypothetical protein